MPVSVQLLSVLLRLPPPEEAEGIRREPIHGATLRAKGGMVLEDREPISKPVAGSNRTDRRQPFGPWSGLFQLSSNSQQRALLSDARRHLHADGDTGLGPMQGQ